MRKQLLLLLLFSLSLSGTAQTFRESILNADLIVVGRHEYQTSEMKNDYTLTEENIIVHHYVKGSGANTLDLIISNGIKDVTPIIDDECKDPWHCYPVSLYCLKKHGNSYVRLYQTIVKLKHTQLTLLEQQVKALLEIAALTSKTDHLTRSVEWMVTNYCYGLSTIELSEYDSFVKYYQNAGLITNPADLLNREQKERIVAHLFEIDAENWNYKDRQLVNLLLEDIPVIKLEEHLIKQLKKNAVDKHALNIWDVRNITDVLEVINPMVYRSTVRELLSTMENTEEEQIHRIAWQLYQEWENNREQ